MKQQKDKTMLVTGASSGIGFELAKIHAENGGNLVLVARREELLSQHKALFETEYQVQVEVLPLDITTEKAVETCFNFINLKKITVDYFVNNAGFGGHGVFIERPLEKEMAMIDLNVKAFTQWLHAFAKDMAQRKNGRILNVGSTAGYTPGGPFQAVYFATKAYVNSLSRGVAQELSSRGVSVTLLSPGATETEFAEQANLQGTKLFRETASPKQVATDGYKAMLEGDLQVITGVSAATRVMYSLMPMMPARMVLKEIEKMQH